MFSAQQGDRPREALPARLLASVGTADAATDNHDAAVGRDGLCHQVPVGCAKRSISFVTAAV
jgi:hypothetical protein